MDKAYKDYTDFFNDTGFIQWLLMPDDASDKYWAGFIERNPQMVVEINRAKDYLKTTGLNKNILDGGDREKLLEKINNTIELEGKRVKTRRIIRYTVSAVASVILLVIGFNVFFSSDQSEKGQIVGSLLNSEDIQLIVGQKTHSYQNNIDISVDGKGNAIVAQAGKEETIDISDKALNKIIVPYGKRTVLDLADGSKVWLNSGSALEFPTRFNGKTREIRLISGEIYIEVSPDKAKPFHVLTSDFKVNVYGTKFNVSTYADSPHSVALVAGSVGLETKGKYEIQISPGEQAVYTQQGKFDTRKIDVNNIISWKDGYLIFEDAPIANVLKQVARYYNISFDYDKDLNLRNRTCSGKIFLSNDLDNVMTTISLLSSTNYTKNNNKLFINNSNE